nr:immunoglobulin heavy chain junction region [Macaca mulatta]MOX66177.1 immunoglobulin heavy chain junction region [Macaca mulatta]MOX66972.1 immunoglobulin heavy chain junction region [Macaca mulatta]
CVRDAYGAGLDVW